MDLNNGDASPSKSALIPDYELQLPAWSPECLKAAAIQLRLPRPRSLAWAILLNALPPPNADIVGSLKTHRSFYTDLKAKLYMDPRTVVGDDPLSQNDESAWNQHFCDNELKALILQDVVRTFPDELYFRDKDIQDMMVSVLFNWARAHSGVGYRQGMHEVLAPLLYELHLDRKHAPRERDLSNTLKYVLDEEYLEHDSYMAFSAVMRGLEKFYTTGDVVPSSCGRLPVSTVAHNPNEVVRYLEKVREECLSPLDSELSEHLVQCNISMELFGIRWLRLLFGREFARAELPALWGFLFADGPSLPHIHYLVVALLIAMKPALMDPDPGVVLSALMRPARLPAQYACALALHLRRPRDHPRPAAPPVQPNDQEWELEQRGYSGGSESGSEGVAEGADVARSLAALALVRARLPPAAAALARALPAPPPPVAGPLRTLTQVTLSAESGPRLLPPAAAALARALPAPPPPVAGPLRTLTQVTLSAESGPRLLPPAAAALARALPAPPPPVAGPLRTLTQVTLSAESGPRLLPPAAAALARALPAPPPPVAGPLRTLTQVTLSAESGPRLLPPAAAALARALPAPPPPVAGPLRTLTQVTLSAESGPRLLPPAAAALARALPAPPPPVAGPLRTLTQLAALLECRNHALIDVETALEAAEGTTVEGVGRRTLVPVIVNNRPKETKPASKVKEVPLKLFHQVECYNSDLPCLDPLRLRTE